MESNLKTIMLTIEHKERELLPKCFLAMHLVMRGFRVYIGSSEAIHEVAKTIQPSIFFHKSTHPKSPYYRGLGHKFVLMDEEGGVTTPVSIVDQLCKWRYKSISDQRQDLIFLPGRRWGDAVLAMPNVAGVKVHVTGWPRVDLWGHKFKSIHDKDVQRIRDEHGTFYLFPTSFGAGKASSFSEAINSSPNEILKIIRQHKFDGFLDYISLLKSIVHILPDGEKIVIRPHPSEKLAEWEMTLKGLPKIEVIREGDISPWILAAKSLLQFGSTTVTQGALNGKMNVQYKVREQFGVTDSPSFQLSVNSHTPEEAYRLLSDIPQDTSQMIQKAIQVLEDEMAFDDQQMAVTKISSILEKEALGPVPSVRIPVMTRLRISGYFYGSALRFLMQRLGLSRAQGKTVFENIKGGITAREVSEVISSLEEAEGWSRVTRSKDIAKNIVCIAPTT